MELQKDKRNAWRNVLLYSAIILAFCVADLLQTDVFYSVAENRILASKPRFTMQNLLSGEFEADYIEYVDDQFVSRDNWIVLRTYMDMALQKKEMNGIYLAKDDYLIEQHLSEDYSQETIDEKVGLLQNLVKAYPQTMVMLAPTADNILIDKLPMKAPYYDQSVLLEQVKSTIGETRVVDVFDALKEHSEEDIYYRTDHRWTTLGAYYAYLEWAKVKGVSPARYPLSSLQTVTEEFRGTLQPKVNFTVDGEAIQMFPQTLILPIKVTYDFSKETDSLYEENYLEGSNQYGFFLDGSHGMVEIETTAPVNKQLFIIKDSYANSMIPLFINHYKKIYVLDLQYLNGSLFDLMQSYDERGNMDVLVLYNCIEFLEEFQYK